MKKHHWIYLLIFFSALSGGLGRLTQFYSDSQPYHTKTIERKYFDDPVMGFERVDLFDKYMGYIGVSIGLLLAFLAVLLRLEVRPVKMYAAFLFLALCPLFSLIMAFSGWHISAGGFYAVVGGVTLAAYLVLSRHYGERG